MAELAKATVQDLNRGVRIDGRLLPWGMLLADAGRLLAGDAEATEFPCSRFEDFPVLCGALQGPATDRPVLCVSAELAPFRRGSANPEDWAGPLTAMLGAPASVDRSDLSPYDEESGAVTYSARWEAKAFSVTLSIYGAPRDVAGGRSIGMLWISWDERLAAKPFLHEWAARSAALETAVVALASFHAYAVDEAQYPCFSHVPAAERGSRLSLYFPEILPTPLAIAKKLSKHHFAIWTAGAICGLSSPWDTVSFSDGAPVEVDWIEVLPAKGGGYSMLRIGAWAVHSSSGSAEIKAAAEALKKLPDVTVRYMQEYNC